MDSRAAEHIVKPQIYKEKWYVWPSTVFDTMDVLGCYTTLEGACTAGKTVHECIDSCIAGCTAGYHVAFPDGKTMCAPFNSAVTNFGGSPVQMLRRQDIYPELSNVVVTSFINTAVHQFPPEQANTVFYQDMLNIKVSEDNLFLAQDGNDTTVDDAGVTLQLVPASRVDSRLSRYDSIRYGDRVSVLIANTGLEVRSNTDGDGLTWTHSENEPDAPPVGFVLEPADGKKTGPIAYGDQVNLVYQGYMYLSVNKSTKAIRLYNSPPTILGKDYYTSFEFGSEMLGFYCDGRECKPVAIADIKRNGLGGSYEGVTVGRDPGCWGSCSYLELGTNSLESPTTNSGHISFWFWVILVVGIVALSVVVSIIV